MGFLNICGFETGDTFEVGFSLGTFSIQSDVVRTGSYAVRVNPTTTNIGYIQIRTHGADGAHSVFDTAVLYCTFYFRWATKPASDDEEIFRTNDADHGFLRLDSDGHINLYRNGTTLVASGTTALAQDTWYRIEVYEEPSGSDVLYELRINGAIEYSGTFTPSGSPGNFAQATFGKGTNQNSNSIDCYYDDIAIRDDDWVGEGEVLRMAPDGAGAYTAWTGTYTDVDEVPHDSDTTYVTSSTSGQAETVTLESAASAGISGDIGTVKSIAVVRDEGDSSAVQVRLRSGTTDDDTSSSDPGSSYVLRAKLYDTDPADAGAWTSSDLDGLQVGVDNAASVAVRCTALMVMVWCTGEVIISGTSALTTPFMTLSGSGQKTYPGTSELTTPFLSIDSQNGLQKIPSSAALVLPFMSLAGVGEYIATQGSGAISLPFIQLVASGVMLPSGTGALVNPFLVVTGTGAQIVSGSGELALPFLTFNGSGLQIISAQAALSLPFISLAGVGSQVGIGTSELITPFLVISGSGSQIIQGSGALTVPFLVVAGSALSTPYHVTIEHLIYFPEYSHVVSIPEYSSIIPISFPSTVRKL